MLTPKERQHLKGLAHSLKPVVSVGKKGFTPALATETEAALIAHELIKIKFQESATDDIESVIKSLCDQLSAQEVEVRGHIATIYRPHPQKPRIKL